MAGKKVQEKRVQSVTVLYRSKREKCLDSEQEAMLFF